MQLFWKSSFQVLVPPVLFTDGDIAMSAAFPLCLILIQVQC